jgi:cytochrome c biogenesis protein CcmG, thiol:disulfide interchange protein DsbE
MSEPLPPDDVDDLAVVAAVDSSQSAPASTTATIATTEATKPAASGRGKIVVVAVAAVLGALAFSLFTSKKDTPKTSTKTSTAASAASTVSTTTDGAAVTAPGLEAVAAETQLVKVTGDVLPNLTEEADTAVGKLAPLVEGFGFDGKPIKIDPADGKAKVIFFIAHWCPHCQREVPLIAQWQKEGKLPTNLAYYTVSTAVQTKGPNFPPSTWLTKENWPFPVLADDKDSTAVKSFGFGGFPFFVAIRADGTVGGRGSGEKDLAELLALLAKAG